MDIQVEPLSARHESEDGALVRAALEGDSAAETALIARHRDRLVSFCRHRTRDADLAEDLAQETLYRALSRLDSFDRRRPMWPWLKHIATNLVIDHVRKMSRETVGIPFESASVQLDEDSVASVDERCTIEKAMARVPARQSGALHLRYLEDWTQTETAEFFDTSRGAMQQLLHRARSSFKEAYESTGARVAGGFALPFGTRFRELALRVRARITTWELPLEAGAPGFGAAAASILVVAATVVGTGALLIERGEAQLPMASAALATTHDRWSAPGADVPVRTIPDVPEPVAQPVSAAPTTTAPEPDPSTTRTIQRFSVAPPTTGLLGEETNADTGAEQDDDGTSIDTEIEQDLPGEILDGQTGGDIVWVSCEFPTTVVCDSFDGLPDGG